jgi:dienelactone hydrolase
MNAPRPLPLRAAVRAAVLAVAAGSALTLTNPLAAVPLDPALARYFEAETARLGAACLSDIRSLAEWESRRGEYRRQLQDMLGLWPWPERTDLKPVITGRLEQPEFSVEKLHFQSLPGLYVTANLYLPRDVCGRAPAILYVCGHAQVKTNELSCGNKTAYQHHGIWFARHGYVCLVIDTLQLGEIEGLHHGTYREGRWWWNARGYTPAGVEAWNSIRALDYLETRPEVDAARLGMTGRSGGGSYTWTTAALDDRVRVAAPVAGITDLRNQVVDGCVEGHCDCMFFLNTYRWDFPLNASLIAPRPLLIVNTDADSIFPLDGVIRTHAKVKRLYDLHGQTTNLGLVIGPGPHKDTQDLQVPVFRWFNQHLKGEDPPIEAATTKRFDPFSLRVFSTLPADQINTRIDELFVPRAASAPTPAVLTELKRQCFGGWPAEGGPLSLRERFDVKRHGLRLRAYEFESQPEVRLRLFIAEATGSRKPQQTLLEVQGAQEWSDWFQLMAHGFAEELAQAGAPGSGLAPQSEAGKSFEELTARLRSTRTRIAWLAPRGVGPTAWKADSKQEVQIRRRFMLLGQTLDGMRVWDVRRAVQALREIEGRRLERLTLAGCGEMGVQALYASLYEPEVTGLVLSKLPASHREGPDYLNVMKYLDIPEALELARGRMGVEQVRLDVSGGSGLRD